MDVKLLVLSPVRFRGCHQVRPGGMNLTWTQNGKARLPTPIQPCLLTDRTLFDRSNSARQLSSLPQNTRRNSPAPAPPLL